ncbi:restriction endonuclease subunit S [Lactobacillus delbrueckii subsp. lactis]|nr:restriction endonuclease subunit S [Lactobacillus delbrueckii subsp. lactis]MCT3484845.1 restriction endonuclease subunit S [Lactobacillus delbrueckii subsp. lactis]
MGDVCDVYDGIHHTPDYQDNGIMFLSVENISTLTSDKFVSRDFFEQNYKIFPEKGDILLTRIGNVGTPNVVESTDKLAYYVSLALLKAPKINSYFLCNLICTQEFKKELHRKTLTTAIPQKINKDEIRKITFFDSTSSDERKKIGSLLEKINFTITLHEEKKQQLKCLKSALLQKMFAYKSGYPAIRFEGFSDEWEQCKLGDVADRFDNLRVPVIANLRKNGDTPYYGANGIQDYVDGYTHDGEYILVAEDGANNLKNYPINYVSGRIWVNNHAHVLQAIPYLASTRFLGYEIGRSNIVSLLVGGGRAKLNADALMNMNLNLPKIKEQELIADLFQKVEISITLQNYKLDKLKNLKSSLLKKMFI